MWQLRSRAVLAGMFQMLINSLYNFLLLVLYIVQSIPEVDVLREAVFAAGETSLRGGLLVLLCLSLFAGFASKAAAQSQVLVSNLG